MANTSLSRNARAQSTVELMAGLIAVIPIFLLLVDLGALMLSSSVNDNLAKQAARAAASQKAAPTGDPQGAAGTVIDKLLGATRTASNGIFLKVEAMDAAQTTPAPLPAGKNCDYDAAIPGNVVATTRLTVAIPITLVGFPQTASFVSRANVPIVAKIAQ